MDGWHLHCLWAGLGGSDERACSVAFSCSHISRAYARRIDSIEGSVIIWRWSRAVIGKWLKWNPGYLDRAAERRRDALCRAAPPADRPRSGCGLQRSPSDDAEIAAAARPWSMVAVQLPGKLRMLGQADCERLANRPLPWWCGDDGVAAGGCPGWLCWCRHPASAPLFGELLPEPLTVLALGFESLAILRRNIAVSRLGNRWVSRNNLQPPRFLKALLPVAKSETSLMSYANLRKECIDGIQRRPSEPAPH